MELTFLGHATWLAEVDGGARILMDPALGDLVHGDVFEVDPPRAIDEAALRPDFIFVSHRHPDHFDLPSLHRLRLRDPGTVVITPDALIAGACRRLGFERVEVIAPRSVIELERAKIFTTPSYGDEAEWGVMIGDRDGVVWNMIDSVHRGEDDVKATLALAGEIFETPLALALVPWQPLLELSAVTSGDLGFPFAHYARLVACAKATRAKMIVPTAAGLRHVAPYTWMNRSVYPVTETKFCRDAGATPPKLGARLVIGRSEVSTAPSALVTARAPAQQIRFRPFEIPPLEDPTPARPGARDRAARWIESTLAPALAAAHPARDLSFVVEVIFTGAADAYTITVSSSRVTVERRFDEEYDALDSIAGSMLDDVLEGRRHWGDPLLAGLFRSVHRANVAATFLYYGLSYEESFRRAVEHQLGALTESGGRGRILAP